VQAKADPCLMPIAESIHYQTFKRDLAKGDIDQLARGLKLENSNFLLLKKTPSDSGGNIYRFTVENGIFVRYRLNPAMREQFLRDHQNAPVHLRNDTARIDKLNDKTIDFLQKISGDASYWQKEDSAIYNPYANPQCGFAN
jgi:hypothetical protein